MADFSITGDTKLDTSGVKSGINSMTVAAGNLIADFVKSAGSQLAGLAKSVVSAGSAFEMSLSKVETIADSGKLSTKELSDQITSMSGQMGVAASDIAEAAYQAISAGQDTSNAVAFAGQAAKLAAAGFTSSAAAVDILTTALNAYGMSADQADHVSDVLLTTQNLGKTSVDELSASMGRVIPLAAAYRVSVENLSSGLAVMTANGIATAEAATYTKSMLNELGDSGSTVGKILQAQTGKSFAALNAEGKSLGDVLQILYDSVDGDSTAFAGLWSSVEAGTGALSLASGGADKFNSVLAQMQDSAGATETAYETMTDTFQHKVETIQTLAENLGISLYNSMESSLSDAAQWGVDCLTELSAALAEGGPEAMMQVAGSILSDLASGIAEQLPGLMTTGVEIITQLAENLTDAMPAMLDTGAAVLGALVQGIIDAIPNLITSATEVVTEFVDYLGNNADTIVDAGVQFLESLVTGISDNLPALITSAAGLIAKFAAALIERLPDILSCGAEMLAALAQGIVRSLENLAEAALACIAKLLGVWDDNMDEWGHIGENIVKGLLDGIKGAWNSLTKWVSDGIKGLVSGVKGLLGIHSPSTVFAQIGKFICDGFSNGIQENTPEVVGAAADLADEIKDTVYDSFDDFEKAIKEHANTGLLGTFGDLYTAVKNKDWKSIGKWAASAIYGGLTSDQKKQVNSFALGLVDKLNEALGNAQTDLVQKGIDVGAKICKGITSGFPAALDSAKGLCTSLKGVFSALKGPLSTLAASISTGLSTGLLSQFPTILAAIGGLITSIGGAFTAMLEAIGATLTACGIPTGPVMLAAGVALVATIAAIVAAIAGSSHGGSKPGGSSGGSSSGGSLGSVDITTGTGSLEEAINANTKALEKSNASLAEMVRQANSLVLSDNMRLGSTVAASGTAQVAAAANSYHREGDTNITQNIYSKAQTAADLQREARWEADRAKAQKR